MPGYWRNASEIAVGGHEDKYASMQGVKGEFGMASQAYSLIGIDGCTTADSAECTSGCHLGVPVVASCHVYAIPLGHSRDNNEPRVQDIVTLQTYLPESQW